MSHLFHFHPEALAPLHETWTADICIYGGNAAGVCAALQAERLGKSVVLLEPSRHLGGLTSGGLSCTDFGRKDCVGGLAREFYYRLGQHYGVAEEWDFEPHVAEEIMNAMAEESQARIAKMQLLGHVEIHKNRIASITMLSGLTVRASMFMDCTYEGDLMAKAGVRYHVGRESNATYGESLNGAQIHKSHQFDYSVSPYVRENDPASGLLPGVDPEPVTVGQGDARVQAYNFRLCLTQERGNLIPFEKPAGYNPIQFELLARYFKHPWKEWNYKFDPLRGKKVDKNNHGAVSTDFIGGNHGYPEASHAAREPIFQAHVFWQKGFMYFMGHDPSVPGEVRDWWNTWGLCRDEFTDCGGWSHALYVREARRMIGDYVMTEADCKSQRVAPEIVGMGSYNMDSHNCSRFVKGGRVWNEGDVQEHLKQPYAIGYRSIVPAKGQCENLLVPVCCSSSHIAYGSIRMEPVFMVLGQSAAAAAVAAIDGKTAVQDVPYAPLREVLLDAGQVLGAQ